MSELNAVIITFFFRHLSIFFIFNIFFIFSPPFSFSSFHGNCHLFCLPAHFLFSSYHVPLPAACAQQCVCVHVFRLCALKPMLNVIALSRFWGGWGWGGAHRRQDSDYESNFRQDVIEIKRYLRDCPQHSPHQTLLFSATFPR